MTQAERDRLVTLRKAKKKIITQREAAAELEVSIRQVKRLLQAMRERGDRAVIHGLRGKPSSRRVDEETRREALELLSGEAYQGFGPTLAAEHLGKVKGIHVSRETVRKWMLEAGLWKCQRRKVEQLHQWRPRRSRFGELVQWDTSDHDWLEGRGPDLYLIGMIDDASSRAKARFVESDSTAANMDLLEEWLLGHGRMLACYTDKAAIFQTAHKTKRNEQRQGKDRELMPPTQIGRALAELQIAWIAAHSPQAKGRIERFFRTAQDRLVKQMRVAGIATLEAANHFLQREYLPWWNSRCTVAPRHNDDAHRSLDRHHDMAAILSHVEERQVKPGYTFSVAGRTYVIDRRDICTGLRGAQIVIELRRDASMAVRFGKKYLRYHECEEPQRTIESQPRQRGGSSPKPRRKSDWMRGFFDTPAPSLGRAIAIANRTS